jgi:hypothetical protein
MKMNRLLSTLVAFILLACLSGVQAQQEVVALSGYSGPMPGANPSTYDYSQFYGSIGGSAPSAHITPPVPYNITSAPTYVYFGTQMQQVPFSVYQPAASGNALWIQGSRDWSQYAQVPQGALVPLLAITPSEGPGSFVLNAASGQKIEYQYFIYPTSKLAFYASAPGRHTVAFMINGAPSNSVTIDVLATAAGVGTTTGSLFLPQGENMTVDYLGAYPGNYVPRLSTGPQKGLDNKAALKEFEKTFTDAYFWNADDDIAYNYAMHQWLNAPYP